VAPHPGFLRVKGDGVSVILLLLLFIVWMAFGSPPDASRLPLTSPLVGAVIFNGGYVVVVLVIGWWSRRMTRGRRGAALDHVLDACRRFNRVVTAAQVFVPAWLVVALLMLGWNEAVRAALGPVARWPIDLPSLIVGIAPSLLAWMGLWWAHFPVDRALREQNLLTRLDSDLPVHPPPSFGMYFFGKLRMQLLFTIVPILLIVATRDALGWPLRAVGLLKPQGGLDMTISAVAAIAVFLFVPRVLARVLDTQPLADPALRGRLESIARRAGVRCRDVLLWRTHHTVGNAAVMGLLPRVRYVMLSDLLVESLRDDQIAAVFAHEIGHIVHRHMLWYGVFFVAMSLGLVGLDDVAGSAALHFHISTAIVEQIMPFLGIAMFVLGFGYVSRRFERQADVYAARTMQAMAAAPPIAVMAQTDAGDESTGRRRVTLAYEAPSHVGPLGARLFNSALLRVAEINNIPLGEVDARLAGGTLRERVGFAIEWFASLAGSWLHGTMLSRMRYVSRISDDARDTQRFDRRMVRVRVVLVALLLICATWATFVTLSE
jgi:STE24 endopeptidase